MQDLWQGLQQFAVIYLLVYAATVTAYFVQGGLFTAINRWFPGRRIQQNRRGEKRARVEIVESLKSLTVTCGCLAGGLFLQWKGFSLWTPFELSWITGIGWFLGSMVLYDTWFYWGHRLMHHPRLYKHHFLHHKSVAPTVWSNYSDTYLDAFAMQSYYLFAPLLLPIPPVSLIAQRFWEHVTGMVGHSGFEYFADRSTRYPSPMVCTTFHDQHHEHFRYNYANFFSFWDRVCGTLHPSYDAEVKRWSAVPWLTRTPAE